MTSWTEPDYLGGVHMTQEQTRFLGCGNFRMQLHRPNKVNPLSGMVWIQKQLVEPALHSAWFWVSSPNAKVPINQEIKIKLLEFCDPLYIDDSSVHKLAKELPILLTAQITEAYVPTLCEGPYFQDRRKGQSL